MTDDTAGVHLTDAEEALLAEAYWPWGVLDAQAVKITAAFNRILAARAARSSQGEAVAAADMSAVIRDYAQDAEDTGRSGDGFYGCCENHVTEGHDAGCKFAAQDAEGREWVCDNYKAPLTCWTVPTGRKVLICEGCRNAFPNGAEVQALYAASATGRVAEGAEVELRALANTLDAEASRYRVAEPVHWRALADATEEHAARLRAVLDRDTPDGGGE